MLTICLACLVNISTQTIQVSGCSIPRLCSDLAFPCMTFHWTMRRNCRNSNTLPLRDSMCLLCANFRLELAARVIYLHDGVKERSVTSAANEKPDINEKTREDGSHWFFQKGTCLGTCAPSFIVIGPLSPWPQSNKPCHYQISIISEVEYSVHQTTPLHIG